MVSERGFRLHRRWPARQGHRLRSWRVVLVLVMLVVLGGCAMGTPSWSRSGRSNCFGQTRQADGEAGLVFFCAESP